MCVGRSSRNQPDTVKEMASQHNDPRLPSAARPYKPPPVAPQDLPVDYSGFIAVVFGVFGAMFRVWKSSSSAIHLRSMISGCDFFENFGWNVFSFRGVEELWSLIQADLINFC